MVPIKVFSIAALKRAAKMSVLAEIKSAEAGFQPPHQVPSFPILFKISVFVEIHTHWESLPLRSAPSELS